MKKVLGFIGFVFVVGIAGYFLFANNGMMKSNIAYLVEADKKAKEQDDSAFIYMQRAMTKDNGTFSEPMSATGWEYWASGNKKGVFVLRFDGSNWEVEEKGMLVGGPARINLVEKVTMDVSQPWGLIKGTDNEAPIKSWSLSQPMHPSYKSPIYSFTTTKGNVTVDTTTSQVKTKNNHKNHKK